MKAKAIVIGAAVVTASLIAGVVVSEQIAADRCRRLPDAIRHGMTKEQVDEILKSEVASTRHDTERNERVVEYRVGFRGVTALISYLLEVRYNSDGKVVAVFNPLHAEAHSGESLKNQ